MNTGLLSCWPAESGGSTGKVGYVWTRLRHWWPRDRRCHRSDVHGSQRTDHVQLFGPLDDLDPAASLGARRHLMAGLMSRPHISSDLDSAYFCGPQTDGARSDSFRGRLRRRGRLIPGQSDLCSHQFVLRFTKFLNQSCPLGNSGTQDEFTEARAGPIRWRRTPARQRHA